MSEKMNIKWTNPGGPISELKVVNQNGAEIDRISSIEVIGHAGDCVHASLTFSAQELDMNVVADIDMFTVVGGKKYKLVEVEDGK